MTALPYASRRLTTYYLLATYYLLLATYCLLLATYCLLRTAFFFLLTTDYVLLIYFLLLTYYLLTTSRARPLLRFEKGLPLILPGLLLYREKDKLLTAHSLSTTYISAMPYP